MYQLKQIILGGKKFVEGDVLHRLDSDKYYRLHIEWSGRAAYWVTNDDRCTRVPPLELPYDDGGTWRIVGNAFMGFDWEAVCKPKKQKAEPAKPRPVYTEVGWFLGFYDCPKDIPAKASDYPYSGDSETQPHKPTKHDYIIVQYDTVNGKTGTWRWRYVGDWEQDGVFGWQREFQICDSKIESAEPNPLAVVAEKSNYKETKENRRWHIHLPLTNRETIACGDVIQSLVTGEMYEVTRYSSTQTWHVVNVNQPVWAHVPLSLLELDLRQFKFIKNRFEEI